MGPEVLLVGESRPVEHTSLHNDRESHAESVAQARTHIAHVANLFGDERAVGKVLLVGRAMGVDGKGHAHLTNGKVERAPRFNLGVSVEHLDAALVA